MKLTQKLLSFLHRVFDKDPAPFLALRLRYDGDGMMWSVSDARLTTVPSGGAGQPLDVDLTQYTLGELVNHLAAQPGYTVEYADHSALSTMGAGVLLDGSGDQNQSNGDHLYGYTSVLWSYMEANARELKAAADQIEQMLLQMSTTTASDVWLDELGSYYAVPRLQGEADASYSLRIITEVLRPRGNNVAIEAAISYYTGQATTVTDVVERSALSPLHDGGAAHDGVEFYNSTSSPRYGLFDVEHGYDIVNGGDITSFQQIIRDLIGRLRDAGTHLRSLSLKGSVVEDTAAAPTDGGALALGGGVALQDTAAGATEEMSMAMDVAGLADSVTGGADSSVVGYTFDTRYNALRSYNGLSRHNSGYFYTDATLEDEMTGTASQVSVENADALHTLVHVTLPAPGYF